MTSVDTPVRRTGRRRLFWAAGAVLAALVLAVAGYAFTILRQYPAHLREPESIAGMAASDGLTNTVRQAMEAGSAFPTGHSSFIFRAYGDPFSRGEVYAAADLILSPRDELTAALHQWVANMDNVSPIVEVPAGDLGGYAACLTTRSAAVLHAKNTATCGWADHGSIGIMAFGRDLKESASLLLEVRSAVEFR
ncbi:MAG: hypothetical protein HOV83_02520 [Catenulispora sp.]|nr:hypothetical protein [Catenulispora sp.]